MTTISEAGLLRLLNITSPAFPTGGFAYSQGLEWAHDSRQVHDAATLQTWLEDMLIYGGARSEAILVRHACRTAYDHASLNNLAEFAAAGNLGAERHAESLAQGAAFALACAPWAGIEAYPYPVSFGAYCAHAGMNEDAACLGFLASWASTMISASIRLGALGQAAGLRVLAALEPVIATTAQETTTSSLEDVGGICLLSDIAAMRHETQYARLFRS